MGTSIPVCHRDELQPGERRMVDHRGREIGVFNVDGDLYAVRNYCAHAAAPLCVGTVSGVIYSDEPHTFAYDATTSVISCPWHHWEYRLEDGTCLTDPRSRVRTYDVTIEDEVITVHV